MLAQSPRLYSYIRFSTSEQLKGDSLNRQLSMAQKYATEKGLVLDDSLTIKDIGISAYEGKHVKQGNLGKFLKAVEEGKVPKGSVLLVESLDRLSREKILDALDLFTNIIRSGIKIVTLADRNEYDEESITKNYSSLIVSIAILSRANEESAMKSQRLSATWQNKRNNIGNRKLTKKSPAWLVWNESTNDFKPDLKRQKLVNNIFKLSLDGVGTKGIAKRLNERGVLSWGGKSKGWHSSYIYKILKNRAVLGEFQPHKIVNGKRIPDGVSINNYYPSIVTKELYYQVEKKLSADSSVGGKTGKVRNLFGGLAKCACGSPMQFVDKGKPPKGRQYLVCDSARRKLGCAYYSFEYHSFEKGFLTFCEGLDINELISEPNKISEQSRITEEITTIGGELHNLSVKAKNLMEAIEGESNKKLRELLQERYRNLIIEKEPLEAQFQELGIQWDTVQHEAEVTQQNVNQLKDLIEMMKNDSEENIIDLRLRLRSRIRSLVEKIVIYPTGKTAAEKTMRIVVAGIDSNKQLTYKKKKNIKEQLSLLMMGIKKKRQFYIKFKRDKIRFMFSDPSDPTTFRMLGEIEGMEKDKKEEAELIKSIEEAFASQQA